MKFNLEKALQIYNSNDQFPIDFENAWIWLGYTRKDNAKANFTKCNFVKGLDYEVSLSSQENSQGGRPTEIIKLSIDCFKSWAMLSKTEKGKEVRLYFLECEKLAKQYQIEKNQPVEKVLPTRDTVEYIAAAQVLETLKDGILKQLLANALVDEISLAQNLKYLPVAEKPKQFTIAKIRAKSLGYTDKQIGDGSRLGKFIKSQIMPAFQEQIGRYPVHHYEISPELDQAIHNFFNR